MPAKLSTWRPPRLRTRTPDRHAHYVTADWQARRLRILIRDAYRCQADGCGRVIHGKAAQVDHRIPLEEGGTDDDGNLQTLCLECHGRKTREEQRRRGLL